MKLVVILFQIWKNAPKTLKDKLALKSSLWVEVSECCAEGVGYQGSWGCHFLPVLGLSANSHLFNLSIHQEV